ncbi:MAG TPA: hypothetical protein VH257_22500, partial [Chloroflexota bacterium]|nr:hypothetical protein [Chloroflexota bacterium]
VVLSGGVPPAGSARPPGQGLVPPISVHDGRWTLFADPDRDRWRLFDHRTDPGQETDLLSHREAVARRLHEALVATLDARGVGGALRQAYAEPRPGGPPPEVLAALEAEADRRPRYEQFRNELYL